MPVSSVQLIDTLRSTARRIRNSSGFSWTHMGRCICGHLAQTITRLSPAEIHALALQKAGDWERQTLDYCPLSKYPINYIIECMLELGLNLHDIAHLEKLSDVRILRYLGVTHLDYRSAGDAVSYLNAFADILEAELLDDQVPGIDEIAESAGLTDSHAYTR
ncbi:MAG: hypothetical protein ACNA8K_09875 [Cyclonatronaceae bacterium]